MGILREKGGRHGILLQQRVIRVAHAKRQLKLKEIFGFTNCSLR